MKLFVLDEVIRFGDPIVKRQKCQQYLNACSSVDFNYSTMNLGAATATIAFSDKKFEGFILGCTLDDQKRVKKRLEALLSYLTQQMVISDQISV